MSPWSDGKMSFPLSDQFGLCHQHPSYSFTLVALTIHQETTYIPCGDFPYLQMSMQTDPNPLYKTQVPTNKLLIVAPYVGLKVW